MTEHSTANSFIVRVYRVDTEDSRKMLGIVEAMDGSGASRSFADTDELRETLNSFVKMDLTGGRRKKKNKKITIAGVL